MEIDLALLLGACDGGEPTLYVDLKTDLVPGRQFFGIRTSVRYPGAGPDGEPITTEDVFAMAGEDFLAGQRVAELDGLPRSPLAARVSLLGPTGEIVASREVIVELDGDYAVTMLITGSCQGVVCPSEGDDPNHTSCLGGRCVDPRCTPETPELCDELGCSADADCSSPVSCGQGVCIDFTCFVRIDDARCPAGKVCDPSEGCVIAPNTDGGPGCPATETSCVDGLDDDCDGAIDCADSDCATMACDDASVCTTGDTCQADGSCSGAAIDCDDGNPCTDDTCDPTRGCVQTQNTAACDDGFWCNGADTCRDGMCQDHASPPCAAFCNESAMACEECAGDADCGSVSYGSWGACGGFGGTCDESGTQSRSVMTPRCVSGSCTVDTSSESRSCARDTENDSCGSTTYGSWGSCGGYSNACDTTGTQSRTRTRRLCRSGSCANVNNDESRSCSRSGSNGTGCGSGRVCCSGSCVSITTNTRCGACNVNCSAQGFTCVNNGAGGYSCRGCFSNLQCQSILNSASTCWDTTAPPAYCECQCPTNGVCVNGGCGSNFFCHDCPGHNFCSPTGGSC